MSKVATAQRFTAGTEIGGYTMTMTQSNRKDSSGGSSKHTAHWRSSGWSPLAYPSSAVVAADWESKSELSTNFPLHQDVILAAARELLILDGTIDKKSLEVIFGVRTNNNIDGCSTATATTNSDQQDNSTNKKQISSMNKYRLHMYGFDDKELSSFNAANTAKNEGTTQRIVSSESISNTSHGDDRELERNASLLSAEDIASAILKRTITGQKAVRKEVRGGNSKPPRKVSDIDIVSSHEGSSAVARSTQLPPGLFVLVSNGCHISASNISRKNMPPLLDISISTETYLREKAHDMTIRMTSTFRERPLREFLGYKSTVLKRDRIVEVMSDFLFDVSHAMFAWEQTEREISSERSRFKDSTSLDEKICSDLFDTRALKKIGGFDLSSLLPHALSIRRARMKNMSWTAFAATGQGMKMLRHHREGGIVIAGQKRRMQRPRSRNGGPPSQDSERGGKRSRSSSIASTSDESECPNDKPSCNSFGINTVKDVGSAGMPTFGFVPDVIPLTLKREKGKSWGISLAKEDSMCIVDRIPAEKEWNGLTTGDIIVSIRNERNQSACLPSTSILSSFSTTLVGEATAQPKGFYRQVVNLFKASKVLHLEVRRVGAVRAVA